jgi:hypothetical protein
VQPPGEDLHGDARLKRRTDHLLEVLGCEALRHSAHGLRQDVEVDDHAAIVEARSDSDGFHAILVRVKAPLRTLRIGHQVEGLELHGRPDLEHAGHGYRMAAWMSPGAALSMAS